MDDIMDLDAEKEELERQGINLEQMVEACQAQNLQNIPKDHMEKVCNIYIKTKEKSSINVKTPLGVKPDTRKETKKGKRRQEKRV